MCTHFCVLRGSDSELLAVRGERHRVDRRLPRRATQGIEYWPGRGGEEARRGEAAGGGGREEGGWELGSASSNESSGSMGRRTRGSERDPPQEMRSGGCMLPLKPNRANSSLRDGYAMKAN
eukprot:2643260-Pleurochrysis_carterae.AAC.2